MKYCSGCGAPVTLKIPAGDNRTRYVCTRCETIHYQNPLIVTGCIPAWEGRVLLCRRAIRPRYGLWTLPAGFMEKGETAAEGAAREALEEANARVRIDALYATFNLPHIDQVYMLYRGRLVDLDFFPGEETLELALFEEADIPWEALAFPVITEALKLFFQDRQAGRFAVHSGDITRIDGRQGGYRIDFLRDLE
ncbi:MAG: NUDIX hydrolase [Pseudomonadota bacterium]